MRTRSLLILIITTAIATAIALLAVYVLLPVLLPLPPDFAADNVNAVSPHYLSFLPNSWRPQDQDETRVFLLSATPRYGYYKNWNAFGGGTQRGDPCFIINITIRNDYSAEHQPPPLGDYNFSEGYHVLLTAVLYSKNGTTNVEPIIIPSAGGPPTSLDSEENFRNGETATFDLYLPTDKRDIESFELYVLEIGPLPVPA